MDEIKIFFIIIGTLFMREQPSLVAEKAIIHVDPIQKTISIEQKNLLSTTEIEDVTGTEEFLKLKNQKLHWVKELESFSNKSYEIKENNGQISIFIHFSYSDPKDLNSLNISHSNGQYAVFQEEKLEVISGQSSISEPYVLFNDDEAFSFSVRVFEDWLDQDSDQAKFNPAYINQPLVRRKSDIVRGKGLKQVNSLPPLDSKPDYTQNGLSIFFSEDQDFALLNEEHEVDVRFMDNDMLMIKISENFPKSPALSQGEQYFIFSADELNNTITLTPSDKEGKIKDTPRVLYFSTMPEEAY